MLGPCRSGYELAYCNAARQLRQRRNAPVAVPGHELVFTTRRLKAADLHTRGKRVFALAFSRIGPARARFLGEKADALADAVAQHLPVLRGQSFLEPACRPLRERLPAPRKGMRRFRTEEQDVR